MALKTIPSNAWETSVAWSLVFPNQRVIDTPSGTTVINYGIGRWQGEIEIGLMQTNQEARAVEGFLDSLRGSFNEFEIPMRRDADITGDPAINVISSDVSNGVRRVTLTAGTIGFKAGDMVRIGNRAFRLVSDISANRILVEPNIAPSISAVIYKEAKMRVRLVEGSVTNYATPYFTGPWSLRVTEAL